MRDLTIETGTRAGRVSAILHMPEPAGALLVLAHGAGAGMRHPFMEALAVRLAGEGVGTLRYQFPYMDQGRRQPDRPPLLEATVRAAVAAGAEVASGLPLFAGGKSMGGRMTSGAAAKEALAGVRGLVFFGFPLHPPKNPGTARADHLPLVTVPLLFIQGTRDSLADLALMKGVSDGLGPRATVHVVEGGDHSFHLPRRSGRTDEDAQTEMASVVGRWIGDLAGPCANP